MEKTENGTEKEIGVNVGNESIPAAPIPTSSQSNYVDGGEKKIQEKGASIADEIEEIQDEDISINNFKEKKLKTDSVSSGISTSEGQQQVLSEMIQNGEGANQDGADEKMLGTAGEDKQNLALKKEEVKFISGDQQNGDAKIDIGNFEKAFTGMTKEELMKYANDPFWIRLRWIFFILFWLSWASMLVGAILIIVNAPKCIAPTPLAWYKQGPLIMFKSSEATTNDIEQAKKIKARGAIYELPPEDTYDVKDPAVESKIKKLIESYKGTGINVVLDITPNYVSMNSKFYNETINNPMLHSALIWANGSKIPTTWLSLVNQSSSAWQEIEPQKYLLSQFGTGKFDLFMNDTHVKAELKKSLSHLMSLGVKGFRFSNAIFFILKKDLIDENIGPNTNAIHDEYGFWTHRHTTFQNGLGDLLREFTSYVKNSNYSTTTSDDDNENEIFLSVSEEVIRPEVFRTSTFQEFGIDTPIYGPFVRALNKKSSSIKELYSELELNTHLDGNNTVTWLQWIYSFNSSNYINPSAYYAFLNLLPGTPVIPANSVFLNLSDNVIESIENMRLSPSYMHGDFNTYRSEAVIAYSRFKSGNPGYFVIFNPTEKNVVANFTNAKLPEKMTIDFLSDNYNITDVGLKSKVTIDDIKLSPFSTAILTYVPIKK